MKKINLLILGLITISSVTACKNKDEAIDKLIFTQHEYFLKNNEGIKIEEEVTGVKYSIVNNPYDNISINEDSGIFTFDESIPNYTQVMAIASYKDLVSEPCVVTLYYDYQNSEVNFTNLSSYIVNNEYVNAISSKKYSVTYTLKEKINGITIEEGTGKVSYSPLVEDGTRFTVVANSHGSKQEKEFIAMTEGFVEATTSRQALEKDTTVVSAYYPLDFSNSTIEEENIIAVVDLLNNPLPSSFYTFDTVNKRLEILPSILSTLNVGTHNFKIITERNSIQITLDVITKFINNVEDLVTIDDSIENLAGYYILMNDLDLSDYLSNEGYNEGKGWTPIGSYVDTLDTNIATQYSFKGTFDGNGHTISGLTANRTDTASFNAGLFGYTTNSSTIRNLGVKGNLKVSSYSGGLVGTNNGVIENCWADVNMTVYSGEDAYRYVGGLVGNNFGTVKNCYAIGNVKCDTYAGSLIGSNTGFVDNCYSYQKDIDTSKNEDEKEDNCDKLIGFGMAEKSCIYFTSKEDMISFNWNNVLDENNWEFNSNDLPSLKEVLKEYSLRAININIENKKYFKGDLINFSIDIYPKSLEAEYINFINYEIEGEGCIRIGNTIHTENAKVNNFTLKISLRNKDQILTNEKNIDLSNKIETLEIKHNLEYLEAGKRYLLSADFTPTDNKDDSITYHLSSKYIGISIQDNVLTIDDECNITSVSFYAISESGKKSNTVTLPIKMQKVLDSGHIAIYENETNNLEFEFDNNINLENVEVSLFNKSINYSIENNKIIVSRNLLEDFKDTKARFLFKLNNNEVYGVDAYYYSHERYTLISFNNQEVIYINSIEDFFAHFNSDPQKIYDENKVKNYDKTFVLTTDLDFNGKELLAIGHGDAKFSGKFYGLGHTISNFKIKKNEKVNVEQSTSCYYGVGLFGALSGSIYDLTLENATVEGNNFVGGLVGMLTDGYIENCNAYNLTVTASNDKLQYSNDEIRVGKIVGRNYSGQVLGVYHNNISLNTIG